MSSSPRQLNPFFFYKKIQNSWSKNDPEIKIKTKNNIFNPYK